MKIIQFKGPVFNSFDSPASPESDHRLSSLFAASVEQASFYLPTQTGLEVHKLKGGEQDARLRGRWHQAKDTEY